MSTARRTAATTLAAATLVSGATIMATGADAARATTKAAAQDTVWNLGYDTSATTTIKKMNQSSTTSGFTFSTVHLEQGTLNSDLMLKDFKTPVKVASIPLAYATIATEPVGKVTGTINTTTHKVTQTQKAYLHIKDISATGHGLINLVGANCRTKTPVDIPVSGTMNGGFDTLKLSGTFTIPEFTGCGLGGILNGVVNSQVSGPGNTITLTLTPHA